MGPKSISLAGISISETNEESLLNSASGIGNIEKTSFYSYYTAPFSLSGLKNTGLIYNKVNKVLKMSFGLSNYGNNLMNENKIHSGLGLSLSSLSIGLIIQLNQTQIESFGVKHKLIFDIGASSEIIPKFLFSINIQNLGQTRYNDRDYLDSSIRISGKFDASEKVKLYSELEKQLRSGIEFRSGIEYEVIEKCHLRMGLSGDLLNLYLGTGLNWRNWTHNYALTIHPVLGFGHSFALGHVF